MAGILNQKQRVMDFILTDEGRSQNQKGDLQIAYASLSDKDTFYSEEMDGVASDASSRIYFEANSRHQDKIVVESTYGVITSFKTAEYDLDGQEVVTTPDRPRTAFESIPLSGSQAKDNSPAILTGITQNFYENQLIGNTDIFSPTSGFGLSEEKIVFKPSYTSPINIASSTDLNGVYTTPELTSFDSLIHDEKFAHFPNFKFMPPVNKTGSSRSGFMTGLYPNLNQAEIMDYTTLADKLEGMPYHEVSFTPSSRDNNILIQPFEFGVESGVVRKLDIVDFGTFPNDSGTTAGVRIFFVGKLIKSLDGSAKFLNIFTLELDV
jgi:hypothetical protein